MKKIPQRTILAAVVMLTGLAACGRGRGHEFETKSEQIITEPATERVKVQMPTEDTFRIERATKTSVQVDTTRVHERNLNQPNGTQMQTQTGPNATTQGRTQAQPATPGY